MKNINSIKKGFTLIELLVVIAIIGILAAIILPNLNTARQQGGDAKVEAELNNIRTAANIYEVANGDYGATSTDCMSGMFADTTSGLAQLVASSSYPAASYNLVCNSTPDGFAVSDNLSATSTYWCVDGNGNSLQESNPLDPTAEATTSCP